MQSERSKNRQTTPALILLGGAALVLIGALLDWWRFTEPANEDVLKGTEIAEILGSLLITGVVVLLAIIMWIRGARPEWGGRGFAIAALVVSLIPVFLVLYSTFAPEDAFAQFAAEEVAEELGLSEEVAEGAIETGLEIGPLEVGAEPGTYIASLGAVLILVGSIMGIARGGRRHTGHGAGAYQGGPPPGGGYPGQYPPAGNYPPQGPQPPDQSPQAGSQPPGGYPPPGSQPPGR